MPRPVVEVVHAGHPGCPWSSPAALACDLLRGLPVAVAEPVDVEHAVQVVELVLQDARPPSTHLDPHARAVQVDAGNEDALGPPQREPLAGEGQTALRLVIPV